jgi:DUF4097 and DUF4098 domain-containing protein YvlB
MRTEKKIAILVAIALVVLGMIIAFAAMVLAKFDMTKMVNTAAFEEKTYDISDDYEDISIKIKGQDLQILKSADKDTHFVCYENEKETFDVEVSGKKLEIEHKVKIEPFVGIHIGETVKPCKLYLPKDIYDDLTGEFGSTDVVIDEGFTFEDVKLETGSGDITISDLKTDDIKLHSGSGEITLKDTVCTDKMSIDTGSGDITLDSCDAFDMEFKTGSGDITGTILSAKTFETRTGSGDVTIPEDGNGGKCYAKTGSGDITFKVVTK